jgi:hypothetical protein
VALAGYGTSDTKKNRSLKRIIRERIEKYMPKNAGSRLADNLCREPFTTIDDCIHLAQELATRLNELGDYKYPLGVRKGARLRKGVKRMREDKESVQIRAGSRTYFLDIAETAEGKRYLRITESRFKKDEQGTRERTSIVVFPEKVQEFATAVSEMAARVG